MEWWWWRSRLGLQETVPWGRKVERWVCGCCTAEVGLVVFGVEAVEEPLLGCVKRSGLPH